MSAIIRGLTIHMPWAWLIAAGHKPIENRSWAPPKYMLHQYLAIHAGKKVDRDEWEDVLDEVLLKHAVTAAELESQCGHILAVARVVGSVTERDLPCLPVKDRAWFIGPIGWVLDSVVRLPEPVPCRGAQGLWVLPPDVHAKVRIGFHGVKPEVRT